MGIGLLCMLGVFVLWSIIPVLIKLLFPVFDPFTIAFLRLAQGTAVVLAVFFARGHRPWTMPWSWWHLVGGLGISLNFSLYALSLSYTTASAGVLIVQIQYVTLAVLAAAVLKERLGVAKIASIAVVLTGVALVVGVRADVGHLLAPRYMLGNVLMLFSGIGWGVYGLANKALAQQAQTVQILAPMLTISALVTGALAATHFEVRAAPTAEALWIILVLGVLATGGPFILVSEGLKRLSAALVGTLIASTSIGQITLAHWLLGEPLGWSLAAGGLLILIGVLGMVNAER
ncbi:MAG: EamA family transporter [Candidatus Latescibacteria bacterium]|nr:EamA family transporter [Candidatus Latescibacterota bacterium]